MLNVTLSVVIITCNEEANIGRTLKSVEGLVRDLGGEIIVVDSGSTDRTVEIARSFGAKVFVEAWKGYAAQKNSAIEKASGDWVLSLDADEEVDEELSCNLRVLAVRGERPPRRSTELISIAGAKLFGGFGVERVRTQTPIEAYYLARKNFFLGRWIKRGGFFPDFKLRLFRRGKGRFHDSLVHETVKVDGSSARLRSFFMRGALIHHSYPTLSDYIEHMNRYSSLGAEMAAKKAQRGFSVVNIVLRPLATFVYNYIFRLGFLDGREGLLLHLYHAVYVSWKYAKAWEISKQRR